MFKRSSFSLLNAVVSLSCLILVIWGFGRGLDFSDEADSLLAAEFPFRVTLRFTETPFYTHWLYQLAGESLFRFRLYGFVLLAASAWYFCLQLFRYLQSITFKDNNTVFCAACAVFTSVTCYYCKWFVSPNYYWLCLCGILFSVGLTLRIMRGKQSGLVYILLGVCLTVTALGRFTSAVPTALLCYGAIIVAGPDPIRQRLGGLALTTLTGLTCLVLHMALVAEGLGEVIRIYTRLLLPGNVDEEHEAGALFDSLRIATIDLVREVLKRFWKTSLVLPPLAVWLWKKKRLPFHPAWTLILTLAVPFRLLLKDYGDPSQVVAISFSSGLIGLFVLVACLPSPSFGKHRLAVAAIWLALFSWAMAFGSNVPVLWHASRAAIFLVAGTVCLLWLVENPRAVQAASFVLTLSVTAVMIATTIRPYLQVSLWNNTETVQLRDPGTEILLWPEAADYIADLRATAMREGWRKDTPLFDLSGGTPGIAYVLQACVEGNPRPAGGYGEVSVNFTQQILDSFTPEQRRKMWIITSDRESRIPIEVLLRNFPGFPYGYRQVWTSKAVGRYREPLWQETLWAPIAPPDTSLPESDAAQSH